MAKILPNAHTAFPQSLLLYELYPSVASSLWSALLQSQLYGHISAPQLSAPGCVPGSTWQNTTSHFGVLRPYIDLVGHLTASCQMPSGALSLSQFWPNSSCLIPGGSIYALVQGLHAFFKYAVSAYPTFGAEWSTSLCVCAMIVKMI